jgi:hypothetical protein
MVAASRIAIKPEGNGFNCTTKVTESAYRLHRRIFRQIEHDVPIAARTWDGPEA